jgi:hypothetical protein
MFRKVFDGDLTVNREVFNTDLVPVLAGGILELLRDPNGGSFVEVFGIALAAG